MTNTKENVIMNHDKLTQVPLEKDDAKLDGFGYINHLLLKEVNKNYYQIITFDDNNDELTLRQYDIDFDFSERTADTLIDWVNLITRDQTAWYVLQFFIVLDQPLAELAMRIVKSDQVNKFLTHEWKPESLSYPLFDNDGNLLWLPAKIAYYVQQHPVNK